MTDRSDQDPLPVQPRQADPPAEAAGPLRPVVSPLPAASRAPPAQGPEITLGDFLSGGDNRLRDLLAFGMAVEGGRPPGPDGIAELRRKAEAELEAHAFRQLHNQAEAIRRQAMDDQLARLPRGLSFSSVVLANMAGLALAAVLLTLIWLAAPSVFGELHANLAQLAARVHAGS